MVFRWFCTNQLSLTTVTTSLTTSSSITSVNLRVSNSLNLIKSCNLNTSILKPWYGTLLSHLSLIAKTLLQIPYKADRFPQVWSSNYETKHQYTKLISSLKKTIYISISSFTLPLASNSISHFPYFSWLLSNVNAQFTRWK